MIPLSKLHLSLTGPTQVVLAKTIEPGKNLMSVATKVALQLVAKLGGRNWKMDVSTVLVTV